MSVPHKSESPVAAGQVAENKNTESTAIVALDADTCNAKLTANWIAALAITGHAVHRLEGGGFLVSRWNLSRHCPDLRTLAEFARMVGARA